MCNVSDECVVVLFGGFSVAFRRTENSKAQSSKLDDQERPSKRTAPRTKSRSLISKIGRFADRLLEPDDMAVRAIWEINHPGVSADYYEAQFQNNRSERKDV